MFGDITRITQTKFHRQPTEDCRGTCQQAATASLLGLQLEDVPNFMEQESFWGSFGDFLKSYGLVYRDVSVDEAEAHRYPFYYLAYGPSPRGVSHAVVYREGRLEWDPHPSRAGLVRVDILCVVYPRNLSVHAGRVKYLRDLALD